MIHFIRPCWLWLLVPVLGYVAWVIYCVRQFNPWKKICDAHLLPALLQLNTRQSKVPFQVVLLGFFIIGTLALAGPAWKKTKLPIYRDIRSLSIVLDLSTAMEATDLNPNRLTLAKFKIRDLIETRKNVQMGLVTFTEEAFVASPLSQDANTLFSLLEELSPSMMPISGSNIGQGIKEGAIVLEQATVKNGNILLITASEPRTNDLSEAKKLSQKGMHLHVLAMLESSPLTNNTIVNLQRLAQIGNGSFFLFTPNSRDLERLISEVETIQAIKNDKADNTYLWQDEGPWLCLLLIPLALIVLREKGR